MEAIRNQLNAAQTPKDCKCCRDSGGTGKTSVHSSVRDETSHHSSRSFDDSTAISKLLPGPKFHAVLLLSDSTLPLGSFAFSSGLESFLAHRPKSTGNVQDFMKFLNISLDSITCATLPYLYAGYVRPAALQEIDNDLDASISCNVAKRASVKQGRALLTVWERSFKAHTFTFPREYHGTDNQESWDDASRSLRFFADTLRASPREGAGRYGDFKPVGHLPPLFGTVSASFGVPLFEAVYLYLLNHAKAILSAAIRASVLGPYQSQSILASYDLRETLSSLIRDSLTWIHKGNVGEASTSELLEIAGQNVPSLDLWTGRHEIIYSRIFNS